MDGVLRCRVSIFWIRKLSFGYKSSFGYLDDVRLPVEGRQLCALLRRLLSRSLSVLQVTVSGFGFRISGFGFQVSGFGFRVSGFGALLNCPLPPLSHPARFKFRVSGMAYGFTVWDVGLVNTNNATIQILRRIFQPGLLLDSGFRFKV